MGGALPSASSRFRRSVLQVGQGSLYPALHRLERKGLISSDWRPTESNRRAKYYELTRAGHRQLTKELAEWRKLSGAIALVLESA